MPRYLLRLQQNDLWTFRHDGSLKKCTSKATRMCVIQRTPTRDRHTVAATCNLGKRRTTQVHRCVAKLRADITDSRRECDKYNGGTGTDGAGSNPVGLENLSSVCRYYSRHPLLGRRIKRGPPPPSASGLASSSIWRSHVSPRSVSPFVLSLLQASQTWCERQWLCGRRTVTAKLRRRLRIAIYGGTFGKTSQLFC